jgi:chemotaxis response regulator CheB
MSARAIVAVSPQLQPRFRVILRGWDVRFAKSGEDLLAALEEAHCDIVIIGLHFDESTAVAALERVLEREETFPVVCVRGVPLRRLRERTLHTLRTTLDELGAREFIDLLEYPDDAVGNARVGAMLERLVIRATH